MSEEHSSPIKNWKQLLAVVVLAFLIPILLIIAVTQLVTGTLAEHACRRQWRAEPDQACG